MRKILVIDSSTLKGHHEIYLHEIISILIAEHYFVYFFCEQNSVIFEKLDEIEKKSCQSLNINFSKLEKLFIKLTVEVNRQLTRLFSKPLLSIIIQLFIVKNLRKQIGSLVPIFFYILLVFILTYRSGY
jgi:hypothetical protein